MLESLPTQSMLETVQRYTEEAWANQPWIGEICNFLDPQGGVGIFSGMRGPCILILTISAAILSGGTVEGREPFEQTAPQRKGMEVFAKPKKSNPGEQFIFANELEAAGKTEAAIKQYRYLVLKWPEVDEAPRAQLKRAQLLEKVGKPEDAFEVYQQLINKYAGLFPYEEVLQRQFAIAEAIETSRGKFLGIATFRTPERSLPLYRAIVGNAPSWEKSGLAQFRVGEILKEQRKYEEAIPAYETTEAKFPDTPYARKAAYGKALCLLEISKENPHDAAALNNAFAAFNRYLQKFPGSDKSKAAFATRDDLRDKLAESYFNKAQFYDRIAEKPRAALFAYRELLTHFPTSRWTEKANSRIAFLSKSGNE